MTIWCGIDPGLSGALAFLGDGLDLPRVEPIPLAETAHGQDEVDSLKLGLLLEWYNPAIVCLELVQGFHAPSAAFKLGQAYGSVVVTALAGRFRLERVRPQTWQGTMLPGVHGRALLKAASVRTVRKLYPALNLHGAGRTKPDDLADAVLLAEYARRTFA